MYTDLIEPFRLPPYGKSVHSDFNPMAHLEVEPDPAEGNSEESDTSGSLMQAKEEETFDSADAKLEVTKVRGIDKLWLNIYPD